MKYLIESIKVENNKICNLEYHLERVSRSLHSLYGSKAKMDFKGIENFILGIGTEKHKLRIVYNDHFFKYSCKPYTLKPINSLRLIQSNAISYNHKYEDRAELHKLYERRRGTDDILIIKNGFITDSYYANVAILKNDNWYTPTAPLLRGTKRQQLIDDKKIIPALLKEEDLKGSTRVRLFNAMIEFGEVELSVKQIF